MNSHPTICELDQLTEARSILANARRIKGIQVSIVEYRERRQVGVCPVEAMKMAVGSAHDRAHKQRLQRKAIEKFSERLDILANAVADLTSEDATVAGKARQVILDNTEGGFSSRLVVSGDVRELLGE